MKKKSINQKELEYQNKYGNIPDEREEILEYLRQTTKLDFKKIEEEEERIKNIPWKELFISIPMVPEPSPRPRYSFKTQHFYVMGASDNKKIIEKYIDACDILCTRVSLLIETYQPIPMSSMTNNEIYLAEKGLIRPVQNPDFDNLAKTYCDMLQGILLLNDNIVNPGTVEKYFSIKPRVNIYIKYQDGFDSNYNRKKITTSTQYLNKIEGGESIERKRNTKQNTFCP